MISWMRGEKKAKCSKPTLDFSQKDTQAFQQKRGQKSCFLFKLSNPLKKPNFFTPQYKANQFLISFLIKNSTNFSSCSQKLPQRISIPFPFRLVLFLLNLVLSRYIKELIVLASVIMKKVKGSTFYASNM